MVKRLLLIAAGLPLACAALAAAMVVRPTGAPDYRGDAPALWEDGYLEHTTTQIIDMPPQQLRDWQVENELVSFLEPVGSIPGVEGSTMLEGEWFTEGAKRRVNLDGGHFAVERILETTPDVFRYQVWGFTTPARYLVDHAQGQVVYEAVDEGRTRVTWTYRMAPRTFFTRPLLRRFMADEFGPFMDRGLGAMAVAAAKAS